MMSKTTKRWLIAATSLVVIGLVVFAAAMEAYHWDFTELNTAKYITSTYTIDQDFHSISVDTETADIRFVLTDDTRCKVVCYDHEKTTYSPAVQDGTLCINSVDSRQWYEHIGIYISNPSLTVYLPGKEYAALTVKEDTGDIEIPADFQFENVDIHLSTGYVKYFAATQNTLKIKASTGSILVENTTVGNLDLSASTGKIAVSKVTCEGDANFKVSTGKTVLTGLTCKKLTSHGDTGDAALKSVIAAELISIQRSTGDVKLDGCDAAQLFIRTDTGDVKGTLLTDKIFIAQTDTGKINVPKTTIGGKCEVTTSTGNIQMAVQ